MSAGCEWSGDAKGNRRFRPSCTAVGGQQVVLWVPTGGLGMAIGTVRATSGCGDFRCWSEAFYVGGGQQLGC